MRLLFIVLSLCIASVAYGAQGKPSENHQPQAKSAGKKQGTDSNPLVIKMAPPSEAEQKATEEKEHRKEQIEDQLADYTHTLATFTVVLAVFGGFQLLVFAWQGWQLKKTVVFAAKQAEDMSHSIEESARAATAMERVSESLKSSAESAAVSVATSKAIAERQKMLGALQLRAFVSERNPGHQRRPVVGGGFRYYFQAQWWNDGATPTRELRTYVRFELRDTPLPAGYAFEVTPEHIATAFLPPRNFILSPVLPIGGIQPEDLAAVHAGNKFAYLWGVARYKDAFPDTPEHITKFCLAIVVNGDPSDPDPSKVDFMYQFHAEHNCCDDDCA